VSFQAVHCTDWAQSHDYTLPVALLLLHWQHAMAWPSLRVDSTSV